MTVQGLEAMGLERMGDTEIRDFIDNQRVGVLAVTGSEAPYVLPLTYGYDGEDRLYFTFFKGEHSQKATFSERAERARVLVYNVDSAFHWQSVMLKGSLELLPESEWDDHEDLLDAAWNPELFEDVELAGGADVYVFETDEITGIKHAGLPPGFRE